MRESDSRAMRLPAITKDSKWASVVVSRAASEQKVWSKAPPDRTIWTADAPDVPLAPENLGPPRGHESRRPALRKCGDATRIIAAGRPNRKKLTQWQ
jgi:hypothetical protein